ncbi:MAG: ribonuclease, partial [Nevskia sp.]|nr:ribonuclease [Nevskia sp.]
AGRALRLPGGAVPSAKDYSAALAQLKGREDAGIVQNVMLRSLMQAKYSPDNIGHFGLALTHYAHFTSPIRRYPDLLLHRAIKHVLVRGKVKDFEYTQQQMELLGAQCSTAERRADDATRDVSTWLKCEFMSHHVGEEFDGVVTSVAPFGLFVELEDLFIDGLIHVSNLVGDFYEFDAKHQRLVGQRSKRVYALGEKLRVKVMRVSLDERKIDLEAVASAPQSGEKRGRANSKSGEARSGKGAHKSGGEPTKSGAGKPGPARRGRRR